MKVLNVQPFHEGLQRNLEMLNRLETEMLAIERAVEGLVALEDALKGAGGEAIRSFYKESHLPFLQFFKEFKNSFADILRRMAEALTSFEANQLGYIEQGFLEGEIQQGLNEIGQITDELTNEANRLMDNVADIVRLPHLDDSGVQESVRDAGKRRDDTIDGLMEFDQSQTAALVSVGNDLSTMESRISDLETRMTEKLTKVGFPIESWKAFNVHDPLYLSLAAGNPSLLGLSGVTTFNRPGSVYGADPYAFPGMYTYATPLNPNGVTGTDVTTTPIILTTAGESINTELTCTVPTNVEKVEEDDGNWVDWLLGGISFTLDVIPIVSNIKSGIESFTGKDLITQREFTTIERAIVAASILGGPISKGVTKIGKVGVELVSTGAKQIPKYADILANQYNKIKHVVNPAKIQTAIEYAYKQTTKAVQYGKRHAEAFAKKILDQPIVFGPQLVTANGAIPSKTVRDVLADGKESIHTMAKKVEDKFVGGKIETTNKASKAEIAKKDLMEKFEPATIDIDIPVAKGEMPWGPGNIAKGIKALSKSSKVVDGKAGKSVNSVSANNVAKGTGIEYKNYKAVEYIGKTKVNGEVRDTSRRVFQRLDIDYGRVDPKTGKTNHQLMKSGRPPIWKDGTRIELHHLIQREPGSMVELPSSMHKEYDRILHGLVENGGSFRNDTVLKKQYENFRTKYWRWRAKQIDKDE